MKNKKAVIEIDKRAQHIVEKLNHFIDEICEDEHSIKILQRIASDGAPETVIFYEDYEHGKIKNYSSTWSQRHHGETLPASIRTEIARSQGQNLNRQLKNNAKSNE